MRGARLLRMRSRAPPPRVRRAPRPASPRSSSGRVAPVVVVMRGPFVRRSGEPGARYTHADGLDRAVALVGHGRPAAGAGADEEGAAGVAAEPCPGGGPAPGGGGAVHR